MLVVWGFGHFLRKVRLVILRDGEGIVSAQRLEYVEKRLGVEFPRQFVELVRDEDGGDPEDGFDSILFTNPDSNRVEVTGIGGFLTIEENEYYSILDNYFDPPEGFPEGLLGFAFLGSDRFCFDYREGKHLKDPPIVYWIQGNEPGKDIAFLANNFEDFIGMFKPEGYYDHLLGGSSGE